AKIKTRGKKVVIMLPPVPPPVAVCAHAGDIIIVFCQTPPILLTFKEHIQGTSCGQAVPDPYLLVQAIRSIYESGS
ncbi:MAG: hypothetical protein AAF418_00210, partial [Pseudomonadota bacterium]